MSDPAVVEPRSSPSPSSAALFPPSPEETPRAATGAEAPAEGEEIPTAAEASGLRPRSPESSSDPPPSRSPRSSLESRLVAAERERRSALERLRSLEESVLRPGFRPPSAWAEREAAHRRERATWQSLASEAAARVRELEARLAAVSDGTALEAAERRAGELERKASEARAEAEAAKASLLDLRLRVEDCDSDLRFVPSAKLERGKGTIRLLSGDGGVGTGEVLLSTSSKVSELRAAFDDDGAGGGDAPAPRVAPASASLPPKRAGSATTAASTAAGAVDGFSDAGAPAAATSSAGAAAAAASSAGAAAAAASSACAAAATTSSAGAAVADAPCPNLELSSPSRPRSGGGDDSTMSLGAPKTPSPFKRSGRSVGGGGMSARARVDEDEDEEEEEHDEEDDDDGVTPPRPSSSSSRLEAALAEALSSRERAESEASLLRRRFEELLVEREREREAAAMQAAPASPPSRKDASTATTPPAVTAREEQARDHSSSPSRPSRSTSAAPTAAAPAAASPEEAADAAERALGSRRRRTSSDFDAMPPPLDDSELEAAAAAAERDALMEELVSAKIELAEAEGERLRAARATLRARELRDGAMRALDGVRAALLLHQEQKAAAGAVDGSSSNKSKKSSVFDLKSKDANGATPGRGDGGVGDQGGGGDEGERQAPALEPEIAAALARAGAEILKAAEEFA